MPDFDAFVRIDSRSRAEDAWDRIMMQPTDLVVRRQSSNLPVQVVRVEIDNTHTEIMGNGGATGKQGAVVFGVRNHPTVPDTDIQRDDVFAYEGMRFRVVSVMRLPGQVQANCEMMS